MFLIFLSAIAGFIGALLGLGGGIIIVPVLTLIYGVEIRSAVAISLLSVVATSIMASSVFVKENLTNFRVAIFLQVGTVAGALTGYFLGKLVESKSLFILFGCFLIFSALLMLRSRNEQLSHQNHPLAEKLKLHTSTYNIDRPMPGFLGMYFAGIMSALLGIGSGALKVLSMDYFMKMPIKASTATSNFMIGVTAASSAAVFLANGEVIFSFAVPVTVGICIGAYLGAKALVKAPALLIRRLFVIVLLLIAVQMLMRGASL